MQSSFSRWLAFLYCLLLKFDNKFVDVCTNTFQPVIISNFVNECAIGLALQFSGKFCKILLWRPAEEGGLTQPNIEIKKILVHGGKETHGGISPGSTTDFNRCRDICKQQKPQWFYNLKKSVQSQSTNGKLFSSSYLIKFYTLLYNFF